jgi:predicted transcriptional regulator/fibronectin type 3 domain-containing protein
MGRGNMMGRMMALVIVLMLSLGPVAQAAMLVPDAIEEPGTFQAPPPSPATFEQEAREKLSNIDGFFTENLGQKGEGAGDLYCLGSPLSVAFGEGWISYDYHPSENGTASLVRMSLHGANKVAPVGRDPMPHKNNYFIGNDPDKWVRGARNFREVLYSQIYDGIDLSFDLSEGRLKYELVVHPGADPIEIVMVYEGANNIFVDQRTGELLIDTAAGTLVDDPPFVYQGTATFDNEVLSNYAVFPTGEVTFTLGEYDRSLPLVIDPGLEFSTYLGDQGRDWIWGLDVDGQGNTYVCGFITAVQSNFPSTPGAYKTVSTTRDGYITKLNSTGTSLDYSTFIGGDSVFPAEDLLYDLVVDNQGNAIATGRSSDPSFPTTAGVMDRTIDGSDAIIVKLNQNGSDLVFSTFLGEDGVDSGRQISLFTDGRILVSGVAGDGFPVVGGCYDTVYDSGDYFGAIISANASKVLRCTYIPKLTYHKLSGNGYIYFYGTTKDFSWPPCNSSSFQMNHAGNDDGFIIKMDQSLSRILAATYLGGSMYDNIIKLDEGLDGSVYAFATCFESNDYPITNDAYQTQPGNSAYSILTADLTTMEYGTYFGTAGYISNGIVTPNGDVIIMGNAEDGSVPITNNSFDDTHNGGYDIYISRFNSYNELIYSSYLGGSGSDEGQMGVIHHEVNTTVILRTTSIDYPITPGAFDSSYTQGDFDCAITRLWTGPSNDADVPSPPRNLTTNPGDRVVELSWNPPADNGGSYILGYKVFRGFGDGELELIATVRERTRFIDLPESLGEPHRYAVVAFNFKHESNMSEMAYVTPYGSPLAPEDFNVSTKDGKVFLNWTPPTDTGGLPILGYTVSRGHSILNVGDYARIEGESTFEDTNVTLGRTYVYRLRAFNSMGDGRNTTNRYITPMTVPARIPVFWAIPGDGSVQLDWSLPPSDGGSMLLGFKVFRGTSTDTMDVVTEVFDPSISLYEDKYVTNGLTYYYSVVAFNDRGNGPLSDIIYATPLGVPGTPYEFVGNGSDRQIELSWEAPSITGGAKHLRYRIFRGASFDELNEFDVSDGLTYYDNKVENGQTYWYRVAAFNALWEGEPSQVIDVMPYTTSGPPSALSFTSEDDRIELVWIHPEDTGGTPLELYRIYRGIDIDSMEVLVELPPSVLRFTDTDVVGGTTYHYYVVPVTGAGEGDRSDIIDWTPRELPGAPLNLDAQAGAGYINLSWLPGLNDGGLPITRYIIMRGTSGADLDIHTSVGLQTEYTDEDVEGGVTYYYSVLAENDVGVGKPSEQVHAIPWWIPEAPSSFSVTLRGTTASLEWESPEEDRGAPVTGYVIFRGTSGDDLVELIGVDLILLYADEGLERGQTYYYCVAAVNKAGTGDPSFVESIEVKMEMEPVRGSPWWIILVGLGFLMAAMISVMGTESGRYRWGLLLGPLTTRLKREEVLDNKTRHALLGIIIANPGIHYNAIMKEFDLKNGVAAYHLSVLEEKNYIRSARDGRLKRFYSTDVKVPSDLRLTPEGIREAITDLVVAQPGISQKGIVNELGIDDDTVGYHLRAMVESGELHSAKQGRYTVYTRDT